MLALANGMEEATAWRGLVAAIGGALVHEPSGAGTCPTAVPLPPVTAATDDHLGTAVVAGEETLAIHGFRTLVLALTPGALRARG